MHGLWMRRTVVGIVAVLTMLAGGLPVVPAAAGTAILNFPTGPCPADGAEHALGGYAFFGGVPYVIRAVAVTGAARIQLRTVSAGVFTFDEHGAFVVTPAEVPRDTILAEVTGTPAGVSRAFTIEWQANMSVAAYCVNTGTAAVTPVITVYYEAYE